LLLAMPGLQLTRSGGASELPTNPPTAASEAKTKALYLKGETALQEGDLSTAEGAFREIVAHNPADPGAYANLGVIYMRRRNWPLALRYFQTARKLAPKVPGIRLNIGLAYYRQGNFASAVAPFQSVLQVQPGSLQACYLF